eukprot:CAMPEP_0206216106 /NCGR_PEP_ID=MMETSP0047_2-20121206/2546_1 /ASSEMBLY_ACC=CAM_ASM_000192 /TAXON_ID=195065 /ORGANISM="Chroomonas mesostigmatica_cf, Strain CCMP1168" /LENGTH=304 /DNA_ID=CAMNT_0053638435 /DNA_START=170 /DNA_END=1081 /DNA_ORIENTATION=+
MPDVVTEVEPGARLMGTMRLLTSLNQTVSSSEGFLPYLGMLRVTNGRRGTLFFRPDGRFHLRDARVDLFWPIKWSGFYVGPPPDPPPPTVFDSEMFVTLEMLEPAFGALIPPYTFRLNRRPCPPGTSYVLDLASCRFCRRLLEYAIDPDQDECQPIPTGVSYYYTTYPGITYYSFTSQGSGVVSKVPGAIWSLNGIRPTRYRLDSCPAGYILVRDEEQPLQDTCVLCPPGTFSNEDAVYATGVRVSATEVQAPQLCDVCNPSLIKCNGGNSTSPIDIEVVFVGSVRRAGAERGHSRGLQQAQGW